MLYDLQAKNCGKLAVLPRQIIVGRTTVKIDIRVCFLCKLNPLLGRVNTSDRPPAGGQTCGNTAIATTDLEQPLLTTRGLLNLAKYSDYRGQKIIMSSI